ncbi:penicillin amidase [Lutibacter oricola]|uniref:Penicillin amidase n=1 Tax=Lutibacter oricola TaxID=762486 RepID=A0A1H3EI55_9FLAO|nr:penicillin acylase family protein [Lutibacter oricola]SDX77609.1 penicillin amidase [Lutibacter oricola]
MRVLKKIILAFLAIVVIMLIGGWIYYTSMQPNYSGNIKLHKLQKETTTYFDDYGIPHIYAENKLDAYTMLGYVHAQDRLWQMELMRRIAPGKLSEIFGKDMLENDKFFTTLGIDEVSEKAINNLDKNSETYKIAEAYANGVNQFIDNGATPIEFTLIGIEKQAYTIKDMYNILGYMSFSFAMAQKTDPLLSSIKEKLGNAYLKDLNIDVNPNTLLIKNSKQQVEEFEQLSAQVTRIINKSPIPAFIGSNSWVVSANKTSTGNVLFANDPHIGFSQPGVWYEAHLSATNYEMYGYHIAGVPFPLLGHNREYAYGLTMFENDDLDFYKEENHPTDSTKYKTANGYKKYSTITKTIKVKDANAVTLTVKNTSHGPIINNLIETVNQQEPISMFWVYTHFNSKLLTALNYISGAKKMADVKKGASLIHAPGLNIMYGDAKGNVAWWAAGKLYKQKPHVNRKFILNGVSGEDDVVKYLNFSENPMAENPTWNYVYSANNQPDSIANMLYPGYYLPEDRAKRIVELIEQKNNWSRKDFSTMINDVTSSVSPSIVKKIVLALKNEQLNNTEKEVLEILKKWDGSNTTEQIAPTIYHKWVYLYLKNTFEDELGEQLFTQIVNTHLFKRVIADHINKENSIWWDNVKTFDKKETKNNILVKSFKESVVALQNQLGKTFENWKWGNVHTVEHSHPLGTVESLKPYFNVGPFASKGTREVINNRGFEYNNSGLYTIKSGPSTRRIVDFSDIENSISILPTGQSGNPFSKHYKDQAEMFNKGEFRKMRLNKNEIIKVSTKLTALPKNE